MKRKLSALIWALDFYPLLIFQVGSDKFVSRIPSAIKRGSSALGQLVKGSGAQCSPLSFQLQGMMREETGRSITDQ